MPRLKEQYKNEVVPALMKKFSYKNIMQAPRLEKVVLNMGMGDIKDNPKSLDVALKILTDIAGQRPVVTTAKKSVANFKLREGMKIGAKVTIRGDRMYEFLDKYMNLVLPRVRDFRGITGKCFDGRGNFAMGLKELLVFPEVNYDDIDKTRGIDVIIVTTAKSDEEGKELLSELGMPFKQ